MRFALTDEQQMVQAMAREFAETHIKPIADEIDREARFPHETVKRMGELGLLGIVVPEAWGGGGGDTVAYVVALIEIAKQCASHAVVMSVNNSLYCWPILAYGTDAQKARLLTPFAAGQKIGAFALTEPQAGSDASNQQTIAVRDGDHYVLNGRKVFVTNGRESSAVLAFCQTDRAKGRQGITALVVEKDTPGFLVTKTEDKLGLRASDTAELVFEDCRVPVANRLGEEGQGYRIALAALDGGRIGIAAQAIGIAEGAYERALAYARERRAFGVPIGQHQMVQWMLADMATAIEAARLLTLRAAALKDAGRPYATASSMAKLFAAEMAMKVTTDAVQIHGGYGYIREYQVERAFRDAKITQIYEGTSQIQKLVIARDVLGVDASVTGSKAAAARSERGTRGAGAPHAEAGP
jgi:alkylation response protein AidB-like acyl-CoA dehydrogenase